jgi:hypothetical protein
MVHPAGRRVLMLGLDGFDPETAAALMREGRLPALQALAQRSARVALDHGPARWTGLAWEHAPADAGRWAAVSFDPATYEAWQEVTALPPFTTGLRARTVVFDAPYFDLLAVPDVRGMVAWGAHDPGAPAADRPAGLAAEVRARFGPYPAEEWVYGFVWPSPARTRAMGQALVEAVAQRSAITRWLLSERLPDWDLAYVVVSELHSAVEALCHGSAPGHPLGGLPSAAPARDGMLGTYEAVDRLVGELVEAFPDVTVVAFNFHGMGANRSDVLSMLLLPDLLLRHYTGESRVAVRPEWVAARPPLLGEHEWWEESVYCGPGAGPATVPRRRGLGRRARRMARLLARRLGLAPARPAGMSTAPGPVTAVAGDRPARASLQWMPAARYADRWPEMDAFALPSFYDGRVRINLAGREAGGRVQPARYAAACDEVEALLRECRDILTGQPVVESIARPVAGDPLRAGPTEADLVVTWRIASTGLRHPRLGDMGPVPQRRPGGHTGGDGVAYIAGPGIAAGDHGRRSAFDVVPTVLSLLGEAAPRPLSGTPLLLRDVHPAR